MVNGDIFTNIKVSIQMKFTKAATDAILEVMLRKGLDIEKYFLEINIMENNLGITFTTEQIGLIREHNGLRVIYGNAELINDEITVDYGEVNGKKGIIFLGVNNVDKSNR